MTNKYYYNDILVRTSATHEYHYAVIKELDGGFAVLGCSKTYEGAVANRRSQVSFSISQLEFCEKLNDARKNGKAGFFAKGMGRKETYRKTSEYDNDKYLENLDELIEHYKNFIEDYYNTTKIVEIEKR